MAGALFAPASALASAFAAFAAALAAAFASASAFLFSAFSFAACSFSACRCQQSVSQRTMQSDEHELSAAYMAAGIPISDGNLRRCIKLLDTNGDGLIDLDEFKSLAVKVKMMDAAAQSNLRVHGAIAADQKCRESGGPPRHHRGSPAASCPAASSRVSSDESARRRRCSADLAPRSQTCAARRRPPHS